MRSLIDLTKRELEERARGCAVIINGRVAQVICETCKKEDLEMGL
jgi:hypothetical protein